MPDILDGIDSTIKVMGHIDNVFRRLTLKLLSEILKELRYMNEQRRNDV